VLQGPSVLRVLMDGPYDAVLSAIGNGASGIPHTCADGTRNIVTAMQSTGHGRFIGISALGVSKEFNNLFSRVFINGIMMADILEDLRKMEAIVTPLSMEWTLVRPQSLADGPHTGKYRVLLAPDGKQITKINRADLADFMIKEMEEPGYIRLCPAIGY
jgi:putative NADH-flavin reductase